MATLPLLIWGAGGHAKVVSDIVRLQNVFDIAGFIEDPTTRLGDPFYGSTIIGGREQLNAAIHHVLLAFGNCAARLSLTRKLLDDDFRLATAIHPRAIVAADVVIGAGSMIIAGAILNPGVTIGRSVIVNTAASIDHDCTIADAAHVCPGVRLAGGVSVGEAAWVGIGATVVQNVKIGARAIIGAGAVVLKDVPADAVAYGVPARVHRTNKP